MLHKDNKGKGFVLSFIERNSHLHVLLNNKHGKHGGQRGFVKLFKSNLDCPLKLNPTTPS